MTYLSRKRQDKPRYLVSPNDSPVVWLAPGERITVETWDCFEDRLSEKTENPLAFLDNLSLNPLSGPLGVKGAHPGDTLRIHIERIEPLTGKGLFCYVPQFDSRGSLPGDYEIREVPILHDRVVWSPKQVIPYRPFIGTIAVASRAGDISSFEVGPCGGNMDLPAVRPGNDLLLPIEQEEALLFLGDVHACQGDGEVFGSAVEIAAKVTLSAIVEHGSSFKWPRIEGETFLMGVGSGRPLEKAIVIAYENLAAWLVTRYGVNRREVLFLLSQVGQIRVGNISDPLFTAGAFLDKLHLVAMESN